MATGTSFGGPAQRGTPKPGKNRWTHDQRLTVHLLHSRFSLTIGERTQIFNAIFADHLNQCGLPGGLHKTGITAQYAERNKTTGMVHWQAICASPATGAETAKRDLVLEQIIKTATGLGIAANRVGTAPTPISQYEGGPRSRGRRAPLRMPGFNGDEDTDEEDAAPPTPTPVRRKRAASQLSRWTCDPAYDAAAAADWELDTDFVPDQPDSPAKRLGRDPEVLIPATPKRRGPGRPRKETTVLTPLVPGPLATGLLTPRKTPSSAVIRRANATEEYVRANGNIMLTREELQMTKQPLVPPSEMEAHPPLAGLLFRYWTDDCFSKMNGNGEFVAGKFAKFSTSGSEAPPMPDLKDFRYFWHDVGAHMNREPAPSPWVSTCNHLTWIIRLAVQESKKSVESGRITLIDANAINRHALFHAQPLHKELRKKRPFDKGAFRYQGMREFLVYHKIPRTAVLHTFTVAELLQLAIVKPSVGDLLRLDHLSRSMVALHTLTERLRTQDIKLNAKSVLAVADLACFFGLKSTSATEHIMHVVSDLVQGWCLSVSYQSPEQWSNLADVFAFAMVPPPLGAGWMKNCQRMKIAFLDGVRWSQGEVNARHNPERMRKMLTRARRIGVDDPAKILRDELDGAKLGVVLYDQKQQRLLQGSASQALLTPGEELEDDDMEDEDSSPTTPMARTSREEDEIMYDINDDCDRRKPRSLFQQACSFPPI